MQSQQPTPKLHQGPHYTSTIIINLHIVTVLCMLKNHTRPITAQHARSYSGGAHCIFNMHLKTSPKPCEDRPRSGFFIFFYLNIIVWPLSSVNDAQLKLF